MEGAVLVQSHQQFEEKTKTATIFVKKPVQKSNKPSSTFPSKQTSKSGLNFCLFEVFIGLNANVSVHNEHGFLDYQAFG